MTYEPLVSESRFDLKLRAIGGIEGGAIVRRASDLFGLVTLESDRPEWMWPGGERLAGTDFTVIPVANRALVVLYNPERSGVIGVVQRVHWTISAGPLTSFLRPYRGTEAVLIAAGFTQEATQPLDSRDPNFGVAGIGQTALQLWADVNGAAAAPAGTGPAFDDYQLATNSVRAESLGPVILMEGTGLLLEVAPSSATLEGAFRWYERAVQSARGT